MRKIIFLSEASNVMAFGVFGAYSVLDQQFRRMTRKECAKYVLRDPRSQNLLKDIKGLLEKLETYSDLTTQKKNEFKKAKKEKNSAKKIEIKKELINIMRDKELTQNEIPKLKKKLQTHLDAVDLLSKGHYTLEDLISDFINDRLEYLVED